VQSKALTQKPYSPLLLQTVPEQLFEPQFVLSPAPEQAPPGGWTQV
jgi:hypothetical protein